MVVGHHLKEGSSAAPVSKQVSRSPSSGQSRHPNMSPMTAEPSERPKPADAVEAAADRIEKMVLDNEEAFSERLYQPDEAVEEAMRLAMGADKPIILADTQDNPGCGGTCDTTGVLEALVRHDAQGVAMCVMNDPDAAAAAHAAGEGAEITIELGGKHEIPGDKPFKGTFKVAKLADGKFTATGKSIPGRKVNLGPTALLTIGGVNVFTASRRMQAFDQDILRHVGLEPSEQKILALKSTCHFRADFDYIAEKTLIVLASARPAGPGPI